MQPPAAAGLQALRSAVSASQAAAVAVAAAAGPGGISRGAAAGSSMLSAAAGTHPARGPSGGAAFSAAAAAAGSAAPPRILEIREYTLSPAGMKDYLKLSEEHVERRRRLLPFLGMFTCDTGGELNKVTHFYSYESMAQREEVRAAAQKDKEWVAYIDAGRQHIVKQESRIMLEASALYAATGSPGAAGFQPPAGAGRGMYEFRQYQLHPGYGSVPKLLAAFEAGLPDKIAADPEGRLVAFAHSDVGMLNNVVELWRYPSAASCIKARQAARTVPKWRETIGSITPGVQWFTTGFMVPCTFSPWQ